MKSSTSPPLLHNKHTATATTTATATATTTISSMRVLSTCGTMLFGFVAECTASAGAAAYSSSSSASYSATTSSSVNAASAQSSPAAPASSSSSTTTTTAGQSTNGNNNNNNVPVGIVELQLLSCFPGAEIAYYSQVFSSPQYPRVLVLFSLF